MGTKVQYAQSHTKTCPHGTAGLDTAVTAEGGPRWVSQDHSDGDYVRRWEVTSTLTAPLCTGVGI